MRIRKRPDELAKIRAATDITAEIFQDVLAKKWHHERDIKRFLLMETARHGCEPAFDPVVASGKDASDPHYFGTKPLKRGFCVIDYGVRYQGYRSDVTRTVYLGKPSAEERHIYKQVQEVQERCISCYVEGTSYIVAQQCAQSVLGENLIHSVGHGIGLDIHETPFVGGKGKFQNNMVVTREPGHYVQDKMGIRIEDDIIIQGKSPVNLTGKIPKQLICWP
jgi:Xaa-Pro aminopeptidase